MPNETQSRAATQQQIREIVSEQRDIQRAEQTATLPESVRNLDKSAYTGAKAALLRSLRNQ